MGLTGRMANREASEYKDRVEAMKKSLVVLKKDSWME